MRPPNSSDTRVPLDHAWLRQAMHLSTPAPAVESYVVSGARRTEVHGARTIELYPRQYATDDNLTSNLRFAFCVTSRPIWAS